MAPPFGLSEGLQEFGALADRLFNRHHTGEGLVNRYEADISDLVETQKDLFEINAPFLPEADMLERHLSPLPGGQEEGPIGV